MSAHHNKQSAFPNPQSIKFPSFYTKVIQQQQLQQQQQQQQQQQPQQQQQQSSPNSTRPNIGSKTSFNSQNDSTKSHTKMTVTLSTPKKDKQSTPKDKSSVKPTLLTKCVEPNSISPPTTIPRPKVLMKKPSEIIPFIPTPRTVMAQPVVATPVSATPVQSAPVTKKQVSATSVFPLNSSLQATDMQRAELLENEPAGSSDELDSFLSGF